MAVTVFKTWSSGEVLTASDLNSSFSQIVNNGEDLGWPASKLKDLNGFELVLDSDGDTSITADTDDRIDFRLGGVDVFKFDGTTTSVVNGLTFTGTAAGAAETDGPEISAVGSDTDIAIKLTTKGAGNIVATTKLIKVISTDAGASTAPTITLDRNSASPADDDNLGEWEFRGRNDAAQDVDYAKVHAVATDVTDGTEDGRLDFTTIVAGTEAVRIQIGGGLFTFGVTGGDKGAGTINAGTIYQSNVAVTTTATALLQGKQTIWVPASAMSPTVTAPCSGLTTVELTANRPCLVVRDFATDADDHAQFSVAFPKSWDEGTVTFQVFWTTSNTGTEGVAWALQAVATSDSDTIDAVYGTAVVVTDDNQSAANKCMVTAESSAVTIAGTPAAGDLVHFDIFRDVSDANDDMTENARLIGVKILFTVNAGDDT